MDLKFNPALKRKFDQISAVQNGKRMSEFWHILTQENFRAWGKSF
jgi:hypothetical protein